MLEELIAAWAVHDPDSYSVHSGSELELFFLEKGRRIGVEIKRSIAPSRD